MALLFRWARGWADDIGRRIYCEYFDFDADDQ